MATAQFEFDGVVRLTKIGTTYLVFTLVIGIAALNTGNNALYIGLTFMLGCLLQSGVASKGGLKHLSVEVREIEEAWAGRPSEGVLRITNRSWIWNVRDVVVTSEDVAQPVVVPIVARRSTVDVGARFLFRRRGVAQLKSLDLYTRYPFGFFLKKRRVKLTGEVIVFPRLLNREDPRESSQPVIGEQYGANLPGSGSEIHSFRDYAPGDSLRHVYWKKSASTGRWIVKQTELEAARAVHVVVDPYKPRRTSADEFEGMISAATTYIHEAARRGARVILSLPRVTLQAAEGQPATELYRALALIEPALEPVYQTLDRDSVLFAVARRDERASA